MKEEIEEGLEEPSTLKRCVRKERPVDDPTVGEKIGISLFCSSSNELWLTGERRQWMRCELEGKLDCIGRGRRCDDNMSV